MKFSVFLLVLAITNTALADVVLKSKSALDNQDVKDELLHLEEGERKKLISSPPMLGSFIDAIAKRRAIAIEAEKVGLNASHVTNMELRKAYEQTLFLQFKKQFVDTLKMPDFSRLAYEHYLTNKDAYKVSESIDASHILVKFKDDADKLEKRAFLESIRADLLSNSASFFEMAKQYSEDTGSAEKGGHLGRFAKGRMVKEFEEAAFGLQNVGDLSTIVETRFGLHLIRLNERIPPETRDFSEVESSITSKLRNDYIRSSLKEWESDMAERHPSNVNMLELTDFFNEQLQLK